MNMVAHPPSGAPLPGHPVPGLAATENSPGSHLEWIRLAITRAEVAGVPWAEIESVVEGCRHSAEHRMVMLNSRSP